MSRERKIKILGDTLIVVLAFILSLSIVFRFTAKIGTRVSTKDYLISKAESSLNAEIPIYFLDSYTVEASVITGEKDNFINREKVTHVTVYRGLLISTEGEYEIMAAIFWYKDAQMYFNPFANKVLLSNIKYIEIYDV